MICADFKEFIAKVGPAGRLLGIDWGAKRMGLAVSDERREFVFPRGILSGDIMDFIKQEKIVGIVVGLPLHADGTDSETTKQVREFVRSLDSKGASGIVYIPENLTSAAAAEFAGRKKSEIDSVSAAIILENAIAVMSRITNH